jgi:hypothetical protein
VYPSLQELLDTYSALQAAKTAIQERDFMIATLERAETALAGHADHLTSSLVAAAGDLKAAVTRQAAAASVTYKLCAPGYLCQMSRIPLD